MLTFTISKLRFVCVALAALFVGSAPCIFGQDLSVVSKEVQNLGRGPDNLKTVETLAKTPQLSTKLLIGELHTIRESRILNGEERPDAEHVLWCLRALRYVTGGKDFCAKTSHKFGNSEEERNRKYWIFFRHKTCASFFAMWPSRSSEYIAPEDAQTSIISKWKEWFAKEGAEFDYKPMQNPKPEDWLW
jgi:hypothetical protein